MKLPGISGPIPRGWFYALFALSGFAGLIYESIWSHYLKLMLGHAAYAQTLVLVIFMGGMAIGSFLAGRWSQGVARPLLWYAGAEGLLGVAALLFDLVFRQMSGWLFDSVIPGLEAGWTIDLVKWGAATLMTLPQAILLGATFPLMSAGLLRAHPGTPGQSLSWLYFTNSLGAAIGVLASGFYLIDAVGLPGTILTAGLVNFALALTVYVAERSTPPPPRVLAGERAAAGSGGVAVPAMLLTALLTGAASFLYEIGWIRMLSLVLGSATHSFELMLSAFILGLSLGSFYIRKRIDTAVEPLKLLGWIQVAMALLALLSLPLYLKTFDAMGIAFRALSPTEEGYAGFMLFSHALCLALMLPVTICAGMTLPLITAALLRAGHGEGSIGRVYAANTVGAIAGVLLGVHVLMPLAGLRWVVMGGALVDLGLGAWLLLRAGGPFGRQPRLALAGALLLALGLVLTVRLDPRTTVSGVFRSGETRVTGDVIFLRDGKTATVDVQRHRDGSMSIATNGKVDAAIGAKGRPSPDDSTMVLLGVVPLAMLPEAKTVGVIGMGSGRTTHTLLSSSRLERVDTVEIEPAMVEGARQFGDSVKLAYTDPRSHIHIEDAKTYFARNRRQYDIVMSEPSNPWVSGVSTLFSEEFYRQVKTYIRPKGLFVQWLQLYETDVRLLSTVFNALGAEFQDYRAYYTNDGDMLIVASKDGAVPELNDWVMQEPGVMELLKGINIRTLADIEQRRLGSQATLAPYFASFGYQPNSDYFPVLDQNAASRRFMRRSAVEISDLQPYTMRLEDRRPPGPGLNAVDRLWFSDAMVQAELIARYYAQPGRRTLLPGMHGNVVSILNDLDLEGRRCEAMDLELSWLPAVRSVVRLYGPYLPAQVGKAIADQVRRSGCDSALTPRQRDWLGLLQAQAARDWTATVAISQRLLAATPPTASEAQVLLAECLLGVLKTDGPSGMTLMLLRYGDIPLLESPPLRFLTANGS
ncbi:spermidine synthase [Solimonas sp. K1W22B-7]|uniref:spermine/spermidine synthase domain-containing protein n=1 Tax=Solimonas sp. K1W22B-7 TaxID=2303331 RepID=UPI000E333591|nr:spermidine synthase [Solimonas sp. K1W22B-7]AXQ30617.1 spermidine synthase [Solimonas sp. K1W22B-7]